MKITAPVDTTNPAVMINKYVIGFLNSAASFRFRSSRISFLDFAGSWTWWASTRPEITASCDLTCGARVPCPFVLVLLLESDILLRIRFVPFLSDTKRLTIEIKISGIAKCRAIATDFVSSSFRFCRFRQDFVNFHLGKGNGVYSLRMSTIPPQ